MAHDLVTELLQYSSLACFMPIWQLCANLLIPNCLRSNLSYSPLAALELYVKTIIDTTASNEKLMAVHYINKQEQVSHNGQIDNKEDKEKEKLIMDLENSNSFKQTHSIISELKKIKNWTLEEKKQLKIIAEKNKQISYIMKDGDVASFYSSLE